MFFLTLKLWWKKSVKSQWAAAFFWYVVLPVQCDVRRWRGIAARCCQDSGRSFTLDGNKNSLLLSWSKCPPGATSCTVEPTGLQSEETRWEVFYWGRMKVVVASVSSYIQLVYTSHQAAAGSHLKTEMTAIPPEKGQKVKHGDILMRRDSTPPKDRG